MESRLIDQSDYIESAAYLAGESNITYGAGTCKGPCAQPCKSCGGGCYGCKGSKASKGAEASLEGKESKLAEMVESVLG